MTRSEGSEAHDWFAAKSEAIDSGLPALNDAIGIGGYPVGRIVEVFGPGAREVALRAIAAAQSGGVACLIDCAKGFDIDKVRTLGINNEALLVSQPETVEQALDVAEVMVRTGTLRLIVVERLCSVAMADPDDEQLGIRARLMSQSLRKLTSTCHRTGTTIMFAGPWAESATNNALRFYSSVRVKLDGPLEDCGPLEVGFTRASVIKNKMACPFSTAMLDLGATK